MCWPLCIFFCPRSRFGLALHGPNRLAVFAMCISALRHPGNWWKGKASSDHRARLSGRRHRHGRWFCAGYVGRWAERSVQCEEHTRAARRGEAPPGMYSPTWFIVIRTTVVGANHRCFELSLVCFVTWHACMYECLVFILVSCFYFLHLYFHWCWLFELRRLKNIHRHHYGNVFETKQ